MADDDKQNNEGLSSKKVTLTDLSAQFSEMQMQMREMYTALVGDARFGHSGIVHRVEGLESTKKKWENKVSWLYGYVIGAGTLITVLFELVKHKFS